MPPGVFRGRIDEHRRRIPGPRHRSLRDEIAVRLRIEVDRQTIKPILGSINNGQRIHALAATRDEIVVIADVHLQRKAPLAKVVYAARALPAHARLSQRGERQPRENPDDRDDDQQLDKSKRLPSSRLRHGHSSIGHGGAQPELRRTGRLAPPLSVRESPLQ